MNEFILTIFLVTVFYAVSIGNLIFRIVTGLLSVANNQGESTPISRSFPSYYLWISCVAIFLIWLVLSYINTRFLGFYSLQIFYAAAVLVGSLWLRNKSWKNIEQVNNSTFLFFITNFSYLGYIEALINFRPELSQNIFATIGLFFLVAILSIFLSIFFVVFWFIFGSFGVSQVLNLFKDRIFTENGFDFGFLIKAFLSGIAIIIVTISTVIPILINVVQARILLVDFNILLWINLNIALKILLLGISKKTSEELTQKISKYLGVFTVIAIGWLGLFIGYLLPKYKQFNYNNQLLVWLLIILGINILLSLVKNLLSGLAKTPKNSTERKTITAGNDQDIYSLAYNLTESKKSNKKMKISFDGKLLAASDVGFDSGQIKLWNTETNELVAEIYSSDQEIHYFIFSRDHKNIITANTDNNLLSFWDIATKTKIKELSYQNSSYNIQDIELSPDGKVIAIANHQTIDWLDIETGEIVQSFAEASNLVKFSRDGKLLVTGSKNSESEEFLLWNDSGKITIPGDETKAKGDLVVAFSWDNQLLACGDVSGIIRLWDLESRELLKTIDTKTPIASLAFSRDRQHLLTAGNSNHTDNLVCLWDIDQGEKLQVFISGYMEEAYSLVESALFDHTGEKLYIATNKGIQYWQKN